MLGDIFAVGDVSTVIRAHSSLNLKELRAEFNLGGRLLAGYNKLYKAIIHQPIKKEN
jgi:hypothetical protein